MKYFLAAASGREFEVEIENDGNGGYELILEGKTIRAEFADVDRIGQYAARLDNNSFAVSIDEHSPTDLTVHIAGESFRMSALDQRERDASRVGASRPKRGEVVTAPIPGIVVELRVSEGDEIEAGQALLVLEAMKMQNEIASTQAGVVSKITVEQGQTVAVNDPLVRIDPPAAAE